MSARPAILDLSFNGLRLVPMVSMLDGYVVWQRGAVLLAISSPRKPVPAPPEATTAYLSIADYRRVTKAIADKEEL